MQNYEIHYHSYGAITEIECITRRKDGLAFDEYGEVKECVPCGGKLTYTRHERYKCKKCGEIY
jgi:hypothetical protein